MIHIRPEAPSDHAAIAEVTAAAFAQVEHSDQSEPAIIDALRAADADTLSLVAVEDDEVVGHVMASPVTIGGESGDFHGIGPLSVHPDRQGEGIGAALMTCLIAEIDAPVLVLLGDPDYYTRFGFVPVEGLIYPHAPAEYFLALVRGTAPRGVVEYHAAFG